MSEYIKPYFHPLYNGNPDEENVNSKLLDWAVSEDDKTGNLVIIDDKPITDLPQFINHGVDLELKGQGAHGGLAGDSPETEDGMEGRTGSSRSGKGADSNTKDYFEGAPAQTMNVLSVDEEVNEFLQTSRTVGQRLDVRDSALVGTGPGEGKGVKTASDLGSSDGSLNEKTGASQVGVGSSRPGKGGNVDPS